MVNSARMRVVNQVVTADSLLEGGGFPVRRPFPTAKLGMLDPFLLLDHMGPVNWAPGEAIGAPDHPHRGFETVTYMLEGAMQHRDSSGHQGDLTPGDVQWMTAGSGVVHSELPHPDLLQKGGVMNGFQLWVNLPAEHKMMAPRYQEIPAAQIPRVRSDDGLAQVRVIAGKSMGSSAVIDTVIPISFLHFTLQPGAMIEQPVRQGHNVFVYVFKGKVALGEYGITEAQAAVFSDGEQVKLGVSGDAESPAQLLLLAGPPLNEPVARHGPFVMNTQDEIAQAFRDYREGRMGRIEGSEHNAR